MSASLQSLVRETAAHLTARTALLAIAAALAGASSIFALESAMRFVAANSSARHVLTQPLTAALASLGTAAIAVCVWGDLRTIANKTKLALAIDRKAGSDLALATAIELVSGSVQNPFLDKLRSNLNAAMEEFEPKKAWPVLTKPTVALLTAFLIFSGTATVINMGWLGFAPATSIASSTVADDLRATAQELAKLLHQEATRGADPVLAAIARAIEERIVDAPSQTPTDDLLAEYAALVEQAEDNFGEAPPSWLKVDPFNSTNTAGGQNEDPSQRSGPTPPANGIDIYAADAEELENIRREWAALDMQQANVTTGDEVENQGQDVTRGADGSPLSSAMSPQKIEPKQLQLAAREAVGAATDSGKGPADQAGGGSADLTGDGFSGGSQAVDDMSLPQTEQETGRRIRITLPPSPEEQNAASSGIGAAGGSAGQHTPHAVERRLIPVKRRDAIERYFEKLAE